MNPADKVELRRRVIDELDAPPEADVDAAWADEIRRRSREIDEGVLQCTPAEIVFGKIDVHLRK